mmetsp:Transcript_78168/g.217070  ORF Transcript_78168/g.217070 Transcript_78168/m.217070 type:complete len:276 (+) Transcript_78168:252-1079(+)
MTTSLVSGAARCTNGLCPTELGASGEQSNDAMCAVSSASPNRNTALTSEPSLRQPVSEGGCTGTMACMPKGWPGTVAGVAAPAGINVACWATNGSIGINSLCVGDSMTASARAAAPWDIQPRRVWLPAAIIESRARMVPLTASSCSRSWRISDVSGNGPPAANESTAYCVSLLERFRSGGQPGAKDDDPSSACAKCSPKLSKAVATCTACAPRLSASVSPPQTSYCKATASRLRTAPNSMHIPRARAMSSVACPPTMPSLRGTIMRLHVEPTRNA